MMNELDSYASDTIQDFLDFARASSEAISQAWADLNDAEAEICDLEHYIELVKCSGVMQHVIYKRLKAARIKRRNAKDTIELYTPISKWWKKGGSIKELMGPEILGVIRETEKHQKNRRYHLRSKILDDIVEKDII